MTPIAIATEDALSEAVALRLIAEIKAPHHVTHTLGGRGFGYLRSKMDSWCQMAQHQIMLVLTDLDRASCLLEFRNQWLANQAPPDSLLLRIAVKEVESWVLADHVAMRDLIGPKGVLPTDPDQLPDPKRTLLGLAKLAPRDVRDDLVRITNGNVQQGLGYNARLVNCVNTTWCPQRAAERSPSLRRACKHLAEAVASFKA